MIYIHIFRILFKTSLSSASWGIRVTHNRTILSLFRGSCGKWDCAIHHHANLSNSLLGTYWLGLILLSELKSVLSMVDSSSANMFKPHQNTRIQITTIQSDTIRYNQHPYIIHHSITLFLHSFFTATTCGVQKHAHLLMVRSRCLKYD